MGRLWKDSVHSPCIILPYAHSWIHARFGEDDPLLFDADYAPKPAYFGARAALAAGRR